MNSLPDLFLLPWQLKLVRAEEERLEKAARWDRSYWAEGKSVYEYWNKRRGSGAATPLEGA